MLFIGTTRSQSRIVKFCSNRSSRVLGGEDLSSERTRTQASKVELDRGTVVRNRHPESPFVPTRRSAEPLGRICVDGFVKTTMAGSTYFPGYFKWSIGTAQVDRRGNFAIGQVSS
jgi:hypothetical protein